MVNTEKQTPISMVLYGKAGVGKTIFAYTFPKALVFDFDGSSKVYEKHFPQHKFLTPHDGNMLAMLRAAIEQVQEGTFKYDTIIIDSLTNLENQAVSSMKGLDSFNWGSKLYTNNTSDLSYKNWGNISGSTIALLTELRQYPINIIIISQIQSKIVDNQELLQPNLIGKSVDESKHFADYLGYMNKVISQDGSKRYLHLSSGENDSFVAKGRFVGGDVQPLANPNYEKFISILDEQKLDLDFSD